jgi:HEAT repeats
LGELPVEAALADPDPRVRRAAAMGATASSRPEGRAALLARLAIERDETTRAVLAIGLAYGIDGETVPTLELLDRARSGGPDAPVAALALARRADEELEPKIDALLTSRDPLLRAHAAHGLGASPSRDAVGRLARAYTFEADVDVRRALVSAVAAREADAGTPSRRDTLALAARLDPDRLVRDTARRAIDGARTAAWPAAPSDEVAWLHIVPAEGATLPAGLTATFTGADGLSRPIVFDDDGYALVPGVPAGQGRLRLASRVPAYEAP